MKKFVINICWYSALLILVFYTVSYVLDKYINDCKNFKIDSNIEYIVFGHSQSACAYNDSLISNFKNYSSNGEGYFYTYFKVKKVLECNRDVKKIFVEFTNNQFSQFAENRIWGKYMPGLLPKYFTLIDQYGLFLLCKKAPFEVLKALYVSERLKLNYLIANDSNYLSYNKMGGYILRVGSLKQKQIDSLILLNNKKKIAGLDYTTENIDYLEKISNLCKLNGVKLYFVRSPIPLFNQYNNDSLFFSIYKKKFQEIPFVDLKKFPLKNYDFNDNVHLNYLGSIKVSIFMDSLLKSGVLKTDTFQKWIDNYILKNS